MPRVDAIEAQGLVKEVRSDRLYLVELANGHRLWGYLPRRHVAAPGRLQTGDRVSVALTPFDLSRGKIVLKNGAQQT